MLWDWMKSRSRRAAPLVFVAMSLLGVSACRSPDVPPPPATDHALGWLHTEGARIVSADQTDVRIRAVSWFGLETETCAPHGLDVLSVDAAMTAIAGMGFNTLRIPFSTACLTARASTGIDLTLNPDLVGATPLELLDSIVSRAGDHHLSVILDRHRLNSAGQSELWYDATYPETRWIADWTMLAQRYATDDTVIGADLQNEPHGAACWACGDPARDWAAAATRAGNAVLAVNPHWLILVEGVERQAGGDNAWWGGGLTDARQAPIALEQPDRVVYAPHAYPPSIFNQPWFDDPGYPDNLPPLWDRTWGYLQREDLAPVLLGEFGSKLKTGKDEAWMSTMVGYLNDHDLSFGYWAFNPDSSDTGGLVKKDWVTLEQAKLNALAPLFSHVLRSGGLPPGIPTPEPSPTPSPSVTPTPSVMPTPSPTPSSSTAPSPSATPSLTPSPSATPSATAQRPGTLAARWQPQSSWEAGYAVNLTLSASGSATKGWTLHWPDRHATAVQNAWGADCRVAAAQVVCVGKDWGAWVPENGSVTVGVQVESSGAKPQNPELTVTRDR
ncbi:MAG: cellulase family glycosylhydrolase [Propionibacteriaceae bacterium]